MSWMDVLPSQNPKGHPTATVGERHKGMVWECIGIIRPRRSPPIMFEQHIWNFSVVDGVYFKISSRPLGFGKPYCG